MTDHLARRTALWKQWRTADTRLHRIVARSLRPTASGSAEDLALQCRAHAATSMSRALILKRLACIDGGTAQGALRLPDRHLMPAIGQTDGQGRAHPIRLPQSIS